MNEEKKEQALNFGALGYKVSQICIIWDCQESDLNDDFWRLYQKGEAMAQYVMDLKVFEMAKAGDLKAMQQWNASKLMAKKNR